MSYGLVSVVIAAYNAEDTLALTLESVARQTYRPLECVIVNDGSTDSTAALIEEWTRVTSKFHEFSVRVVHQENSGLIASRRSGFEASTGEYIQFLDADDLIHPSKFDECVCGFDNGAGVVVGRTKFFYSDEEGQSFLSSDVEPLTWPENIEDLTTISTYPWHSVGPVFRRELIKDCARFPTALNPYAEEREFHGRIKLSNAKVNFVNACHSFYRKGNSSSLTGNPSKIAQGRIDSIRISRELLEEFQCKKKNEWTALASKAFRTYFQSCSPGFDATFRPLARQEARRVLAHRFPLASAVSGLALNPVTDRFFSLLNRLRGT